MAQIDVLTLLPSVGQICRQCPTTILVQAYIDAVRKFCSQTRWLTANAPGVCEIGTSQYAIGNDTYNEVIGISAMTVLESETVDPTPMTQGDPTRWEASDDDGLPLFYAYVPESGFAVHPIPDQEYALELNLVLQPKRGSNSIDETLAVNWEYAFQRGALAYLLKLPDVPWSDKAEAVSQQMQFNADINSAKSSVARGYNAGVHNTSVNAQRDSRPRSRPLAI